MTIKAHRIRRLYLLIGLATIAVFAQGSACGDEAELMQVNAQLGTCHVPEGEPIENITEEECSQHCTECWSANK